VAVFLPKKVLGKISFVKDLNKENLFIYLVYQIILLLILVSFVSVAIKPIFHKRFFLSSYSLFLLLQILTMTAVFSINIKNKIFKFFKILYCFFIFILCISITHPMNLKDMYNYNQYFEFIKNDAKQFIEQGYEINAIEVDFSEARNYYKDVMSMPIKWHMIEPNKNDIISKFNIANYTDAKKAVFYLSHLGVNLTNMILNPNAYIVKPNNHIWFARIVIDSEK